MMQTCWYRKESFPSAFWNQYDDAELRWKDEYGKIKLIMEPRLQPACKRDTTHADQGAL